MSRHKLLPLVSFAFVTAVIFSILGCGPEGNLGPTAVSDDTSIQAARLPHGGHVGKLAYKFNLIGYPADKEYTGGCGNGRRIFVNRDRKGAQMIVRNTDGSWYIADCNATADNKAELRTSDAGSYDVYVRILGKPGGHAHVVVDTLTNEELLPIASFDIGPREKGKSMFKILPSEIFDASEFDLLWTIDTNRDYRIAQFRVYHRE